MSKGSKVEVNETFKFNRHIHMSQIISLCNMKLLPFKVSEIQGEQEVMVTEKRLKGQQSHQRHIYKSPISGLCNMKAFPFPVSEIQGEQKSKGQGH